MRSSEGSGDPALDPTLGSGDATAAADVTLPASGEAAPAAAKIGRYEVRRQLGAGGMGVVWDAIDPELDRRVAIKEMRERIGGDEAALRDRARREAQALARLTHPNVVAVHDVVVERGRIYIVMQHVDGVGLDAWLACARRTPAEILAQFAQAGRGLAAAHAAGLIHRDFKPANVLVDAAGVARVTDFGLARLAGIVEPTSSPSLTSSGSALAREVTRDDVVGTPAYMAPEQFKGGSITAAADQFGFSVSLWEALCRERPFVGKSLTELAEATARGVIAPPPPGAMPRRIERALRRGLAARPEDRFPSIEALLAAIAPPRRTAWWIAGGVVVAAAAVSAVMITRDHAAAAPCAGVTAPMDAIWSEARRKALHDGMPEPERDILRPTVFRLVDARAARWRTERIDTCEATHVRHTQPPEQMASRNACLDSALDQFVAVIDELAGLHTPADASKSVGIARAGLDPGDCTLDGRAHKPRIAPPELARRVAALALAAYSGHEPDVMRDGPALAAEVEATGDLELISDVRWAIAESSGWSPTDVRREALRRAAEAATAVGDYGLATMAWAKSVEMAAELGDIDAANDLLAAARGSATQSGSKSARWRVEIASGEIAIQDGRLDDAIAACQGVIDEVSDADDRSATTTRELAYDCLDGALSRAERWAEDLEVILKGEAVTVSHWGADHPYVAISWTHQATARFHLGQREPARALWRDAADRLTAAYGAESNQLMDLWSEIAITESESGNVATPEARAAADHALTIGKATLPPDDPSLAQLMWIDATLRDTAGDEPGARASYDAALLVYDRLGDLEQLARLAVTAASLDQRTGRCDRAEPRFTSVVTRGDAGKVSPVVTSVARAGAGLCLAVHDYASGLALVQRAADELAAQDEAYQAADVELSVAELQIAHGDRAGAKKMAKRARARVPGDDGTSAQLRDRADAILKH